MSFTAGRSTVFTCRALPELQRPRYMRPSPFGSLVPFWLPFWLSPSRVARTEPIPLEDAHFLAGFFQQIRRRQSADGTADDDDVIAAISIQPAKTPDVNAFPRGACLHDVSPLQHVEGPIGMDLDARGATGMPDAFDRVASSTPIVTMHQVPIAPRAGKKNQ